MITANYDLTQEMISGSVCPVCMGRGILLSGLKTEQGYVATTTPIAECPKCHGIGYINLYWGGAVAA